MAARDVPGPGAEVEASSPESRAPSSLPLIDSSTRIPELDGLRGLAISLVLAYHSVFCLLPSSKILGQLVIVGGLAWSGVDLFFVLSGFLIGGILLDVRESPRYFTTFYIRRAYRILPLYFVVLGLFSLRFVHPAAGPLGNFSRSDIPWFPYVALIQNFWMAALGTFGVGAMAATWSLAVEEQFYLTVPLLVRKITREKLVIVLMAVVVGAPVLRAALYLSFENGRFADYVLMPCRADALCLGVLTAVLVRDPRGWNFLLAHRRGLRLVAWILFAGIPVLTLKGHMFSGPMVTVGYSWLAFFYTSILLIALSGASEMIRRWLRNRFLMQLGALAYASYLFHLPLMEATRRILGLKFAYGSEATQFIGGLLGVALTLACAMLSWKVFEKPLLRRGHKHTY